MVSKMSVAERTRERGLLTNAIMRAYPTRQTLTPIMLASIMVIPASLAHGGGEGGGPGGRSGDGDRDIRMRYQLSFQWLIAHGRWPSTIIEGVGGEI